MAEIKVNESRDARDRETAQTASGRARTPEEIRSAQGAGKGLARGRGTTSGLSRRGWGTSPWSMAPRDMFTASPFDLMRRMSQDMDRFLEGWGVAPQWDLPRGGGESLWMPAVETFEREGRLVVRAELPGMRPEEVKVQLTDEGLLIEGERQQEHESEEGGYFRSERSYGRFQRLVPIPYDDADGEQAKARFDNGVLEVTIPVPERQSKRRRIPIDIGGTAGSESRGAKPGTATTESGTERATNRM